ALDAARQEVAQLTETRTALAEADLARLVAIYENMKPKDAARLLSAQPTAIVIDLMDRMRERNAAPILAEMDAAKVTDLTRGLADRRKLPGDRAPAALEPRAAAANTGADDPAALPLTIAPRL
ncbi:MAG: flagellin protein FlaA, partial [Pseudomonadota bacterium]